jgi:hypothetical protein
MNALLRVTACLGLVLGVPAAALGGGVDDDEAALSHKGQFKAGVQFSTGYRGILTYDKEYCGELARDGTNKEGCVSRSPVALDLMVGYGVTQSIEALFEIRLGLERDFGVAPAATGPRVRAYSPGVKVYISDAGITKFFSTLQLHIDTTSYAQVSGSDLAVKSNHGLQFDVHETVGVYFYAGALFGWSRWMRFELEGGLGLQARFP